jgi:hypothetical protein
MMRSTHGCSGDAHLFKEGLLVTQRVGTGFGGPSTHRHSSVFEGESRRDDNGRTRCVDLGSRSHKSASSGSISSRKEGFEDA